MATEARAEPSDPDNTGGNMGISAMQGTRPNRTRIEPQPQRSGEQESGSHELSSANLGSIAALSGAARVPSPILDSPEIFPPDEPNPLIFSHEHKNRGRKPRGKKVTVPDDPLCNSGVSGARTVARPEEAPVEDPMLHREDGSFNAPINTKERGNGFKRKSAVEAATVNPEEDVPPGAALRGPVPVLSDRSGGSRDDDEPAGEVHTERRQEARRGTATPGAVHVSGIMSEGPPTADGQPGDTDSEEGGVACGLHAFTVEEHNLDAGVRALCVDGVVVPNVGENLTPAKGIFRGRCRLFLTVALIVGITIAVAVPLSLRNAEPDPGDPPTALPSKTPSMPPTDHQTIFPTHSPTHTSPPTSKFIENKITARDGTTGESFGYSVAVFEDTIVVGAARDDDNGESSGSAYTYVRSHATWAEQSKITPSDGMAGGAFGYSVAASGDTAAFGVPEDGDSGESSGSAYVYIHNGTTWAGASKLTASDGTTGDNFGYGVAVWGDTLAVGADSDDKGERSGSVYVYVRDGAAWTEQSKLIASDGTRYDHFGESLALLGNVLVVGAPDDDSSSSGGAYVYVKNGTDWTEQSKLAASDGTPASFGKSVALSGDTAVIGAPWGVNDDGDESGSAYVYVYDGTSWTQQAKLTASDGIADDYFGHSVAIWGGVIVVGAPETDAGGANSGSAYVYVRNGTAWTERTKLAAFDGAAYDYFGWSVAMWGGTIAIGAVGDDDNGDASGSVYVYLSTEGNVL